MSIGLWRFPFNSKWNTENESDGSTSYREVLIPLREDVFSPIKIYWGDGSHSDIDSPYSPSLKHTYSKAGIYDIYIQGQVYIQFPDDGRGDLEKIISISNWGGLQLGQSAFNGCSRLDLSEVRGIPGLEDETLSMAFTGCKKTTRISGLENWDVSEVVNMRSMFQDISNFGQDISSWNFHRNVVLDDFMKGNSGKYFLPEMYDGVLKKLSECVVGKGRYQEIKNLNMGNIQFSFQGSYYRDVLIQDGWDIIDGGEKA